MPQKGEKRALPPHSLCFLSRAGWYLIRVRVKNVAFLFLSRAGAEWFLINVRVKYDGGEAEVL